MLYFHSAVMAPVLYAQKKKVTWVAVNEIKPTGAIAGMAVRPIAHILESDVVAVFARVEGCPHCWH